MDNAQLPGEHQGLPPAQSDPPPGKRRGFSGKFLVGAAALLLGLTVLYGPTQVVQMLVLAVVCTLGFGLIPIVFVSWLVGSFLLQLWDQYSGQRRANATS